MRELNRRFKDHRGVPVRVIRWEPETQRVIYLRDGEMARCTTDGAELFDIEAQTVDVKIEKLELNIESIQKKGYDHFLLKEIYDQPESLRSTLSGRLPARSRITSKRPSVGNGSFV